MQRSQVTNTVLMVRPVNFGFNKETAANNIYQRRLASLSREEGLARALEEFDTLAAKLTAAGVEVIVVQEPAGSPSSDSIFPNNWISTHADGTVVTYPMWSSKRRVERREEIFQALEARGKVISRRLDYTYLESRGVFLEGTGSMVLDRRDHVAYACLSDRTDEATFRDFCRAFDFHPVVFQASQANGAGEFVPVYHSNVVMSVGENLAVICAEAIRDPQEREAVMASLEGRGREVLSIREEQCRRFVGNMLQVATHDGDLLLVMSRQAHEALHPDQLDRIQARSRILSSPLDTIEALGGGSARCMLAEVMLPVSNPPFPSEIPEGCRPPLHVLPKTQGDAVVLGKGKEGAADP